MVCIHTDTRIELNYIRWISTSLIRRSNMDPENPLIFVQYIRTLADQINKTNNMTLLQLYEKAFIRAWNKSHTHSIVRGLVVFANLLDHYQDLPYWFRCRLANVYDALKVVDPSFTCEPKYEFLGHLIEDD